MPTNTGKAENKEAAKPLKHGEKLAVSLPAPTARGKEQVAMEWNRVMEKFNFNCKMWLELNGEKVFGDGPCDILQRVERTGSLRQAAAEINMSYSQAWRLIRSLEKELDAPLLIKRAGGERGGGSQLTPQAGELIQSYQSFRKAARLALRQIFHEHFPR